MTNEVVRRAVGIETPIDFTTAELGWTSDLAWFEEPKHRDRRYLTRRISAPMTACCAWSTSSGVSVGRYAVKISNPPMQPTGTAGAGAIGCCRGRRGGARRRAPDID
jgi:hypothetical protein